MRAEADDDGVPVAARSGLVGVSHAVGLERAAGAPAARLPTTRHRVGDPAVERHRQDLVERQPADDQLLVPSGVASP